MDSTGVYSYTAVLMGSPILLKLFDLDESLASRVFGLIKQYEDLLTVNKDQSEVMDINHAAGQHPVSVSRPVFDLIKIAKSASVVPNSAFNLAIGPIVKLWRIGFKGDSVPPREKIGELLNITHPDQVMLDDSANSVFLMKAGMEIDLGAIAKGYIADRVRDFLHQQNISLGLVNLGGNIQTLGSPDGVWSIGLKKPFAKSKSTNSDITDKKTLEDEYVGTIEVANKSVVTSGIYERYFEQDGIIYHHILDPKTGYPLNNELESVTIISTNSIDGDIWSTLIYGMGVERGCATLRARPRADIEAIFLTKKKEVIISSCEQFKFTLIDDNYHLVDKK